MQWTGRTQKRLGITSEMEGGNCSEEHSATARPLGLT